MLPDQNVRITVTNTNVARYRELFSDRLIKVGDALDVPVELLPRFANCNVIVVCDYCGNKFTKKLSNRNTSIDKGIIKKDCCNACRSLKVKESNLLTYGFESHLGDPEMRSKLKSGMIAKYGVEHPMHCEELLGKMIATCIAREGADYLTKRITKGHDRLFEEFGDPYYSWRLQSTIDKRRSTCLERYGVDNVGILDETKEKIRQTNMAKYGVSSPMRVNDIARKAMEHRGPYVPQQYSGPSAPQHQMYINLLSAGYKVHEDYPCESFYLDCAVFLDGEKFDIEFDGRYWHPRDSQRDCMRNTILLNNGWKIIRFRGDYKAPTIEQLNSAINVALTENRPLQVIELDG